MSFWNIQPYKDDDDDDVGDDCFSILFRSYSASKKAWRNSSSRVIDNIFREFDDIEWQIEERMLVEQQFEYTRYSDTPKKLLRKYKKPKGGNRRKVRPLVHDHSVTIVGPNSRPQVKEFGNIRLFRSNGNDYDNNNIDSDDISEFQVTSPKTETPLVDIITSDKEVKIVVEMPLVNKKDIKVEAYDGYVEICATNSQGGKYHRIIDIPSNVDLTSGKSTYRNGILEIVFSKRRKRSTRISR